MSCLTWHARRQSKQPLRHALPYQARPTRLRCSIAACSLLPPGSGPPRLVREMGFWKHELVAVTEEATPRVVRGVCGVSRGRWAQDCEALLLAAIAPRLTDGCTLSAPPLALASRPHGAQNQFTHAIHSLNTHTHTYITYGRVFVFFLTHSHTHTNTHTHTHTHTQTHRTGATPAIGPPAACCWRRGWRWRWTHSSWRRTPGSCPAAC